MRAVVFSGAGGNEVVSVEDRPDPAPGSNEVLVAVGFAGINPADLAQREGRYPAPPGAPADVPGLEVSGRVVGRGAACRSFDEGDRVFGIVGGGGLANLVVVHERHVVRVPDALDDTAAAAVPEVFLTAHDALFTQAQLGLGDRLLVTGANGGVGTAAVQLARAAGATVFATARSDEARGRLEELGAVALAPEEAAERLLAEGGADVVLELVGAPNLDSDLEALALRGRIVIVGTGGGARGELDLGKLMARRGRVFGTHLRARPLEQKAAAVQAFAHDVVPLLADGRVAPIVGRLFAAETVADAFDYMEQPGKFGKVLLEFGYSL
ncbi:MAG: zinc-binding dehydrogenase [Actinomycetota bacterium]